MTEKRTPQEYYDLISVTVRDMMIAGKTVRSDEGDQAIKWFAHHLREALGLPHPYARDLWALFTNEQPSIGPTRGPLEAVFCPDTQPTGPVPGSPDLRWQPVLSREGYVRRSDYLCARKIPEGIELAVCGHGWLGEVPLDWFDDDGELLPEYRDEDGSLRVPSFWDGETVTGVEDGVFVGELVADDERTILIDSDLAESMAQALAELAWDEDDLGQLQMMIRALGANRDQPDAPKRPEASEGQ